MMTMQVDGCRLHFFLCCSSLILCCIDLNRAVYLFDIKR